VPEWAARTEVVGWRCERTPGHGRRRHHVIHYWRTGAPMQARYAGDDGDDVPPPPPLEDDDEDSDVPPPPPLEDDDEDDSDVPPPPPLEDDDDGYGYGYGSALRAEQNAGEFFDDSVPAAPAWDDPNDDEWGQPEQPLDDLDGNQVAMAEDGELAELQLAADASSGFGIGVDAFLTVDNVRGPASRAGWQLGWTILAVQGQPVSSQQQLVQQLTAAGKTARFTVRIPRPDDLFNDHTRRRPQQTRHGAAPAHVDASAVQAFYAHDADGSGELDQAEVVKLLQARGLNVQQDYIEGLWSAVDRNQSGALDMGEWLSLVQLLESPAGAAQLQEAEEAERAEQEAAAATVVQSRFRGNSARNQTKQQRAARSIQSRYRGNQSRTQLHKAREREAARTKAWEAYRKGGGPTNQASVSRASVRYAPANAASPEHSLRERAAAATKMQATFRGKQARKELKVGRPPPGRERQQRLARKREQWRTHAPMHQTHLQELQATARELALKLQDSGIDAAALQQPPAPEEDSSTAPADETAHDRTAAAAPAAAESADPRYWREAWDSRYNCRYYWHKKTKEVRWEMPDGFTRSYGGGGGAAATEALRPGELPSTSRRHRSTSTDRPARRDSYREDARSSRDGGRSSRSSSSSRRSGRRRPLTTVPGRTVLYVPS
jgi:hypothetical protein